MTPRRAVVVVLDGVGIGELPDAAQFHDQGSNTLANLARAAHGLDLPNLQRLGLGSISSALGLQSPPAPAGCYGRMAESSAGKDSTTGHWEIAGLVTNLPFPVFPDGFPAEFIRRFEQRIGRETLGNKTASGTDIIKELGSEHLRTGSPIVYTSADSVFQVAGHEDVIPPPELYRVCAAARELLTGPLRVGRVIARPFTGRPGAFTRTSGRRDFSCEPPAPTLLDNAKAAGQPVVGIGKVDDLFARRGFTATRHSVNNDECVSLLLDSIARVPAGLLLCNLVQFDMDWGHRNDPAGFALGLADFDSRLPALLDALRPGDALFITADHGCDPTTPSTDHSREYVPLLVCGPALRRNIDLGTRSTFADLGRTAAEWLGVSPPPHGTSFLKEVIA